jgi:hypothetical protein
MLSNLAVKSNPYEDPRSLDYRFRQRRYEHVRGLIDQILTRHGRCRIIDLGGTEGYWSIAEKHVDDPRIEVDLINLEAEPTERPNFRGRVRDACDLADFDDMSYDLVHSNSLIEHVGAWESMLRLAANVRRLAPAYFVQTPYFWFPIEPHFRFPLFHWVPESLRYRLIMAGDLGYMKKAYSVSDAVRSVQSARLLDYKQFAELFPDAEIRRERFIGLTKSLLAIRSTLPRRS